MDQQLADLVGVLKDDPGRVKAECCRLNLQLQFGPWKRSPIHITLYLASAVYAHWSFVFAATVQGVRFFTD